MHVVVFFLYPSMCSVILWRNSYTTLRLNIPVPQLLGVSYLFPCIIMRKKKVHNCPEIQKAEWLLTPRISVKGLATRFLFNKAEQFLTILWFQGSYVTLWSWVRFRKIAENSQAADLIVRWYLAANKNRNQKTHMSPNATYLLITRMLELNGGKGETIIKENNRNVWSVGWMLRKKSSSVVALLFSCLSNSPLR